MIVRIHAEWYNALKEEFHKPYWESLTAFVKNEYQKKQCFPSGRNIFRAFDLTPLSAVKVVILGQDPYHTPGAAMGLSFSVPQDHKIQPSVRNMLKELYFDCEIQRTSHDLTDWAQKGVLLLNAVLTVEEGKAASHQKRGWEIFTDAVIHAISNEREHVVFLLWGNFAGSKAHLIDEQKHLIIRSAHPSPLSAHNGFFGSKPYSRANAYLQQHNKDGIEWNDSERK